MEKQKIYLLLVLLLLNALTLSANEESNVSAIIFDSGLNSFSSVPDGDNYTTNKQTFSFVASNGSKYAFETRCVKRLNAMLLVQGNNNNYVKSPKISAVNGYVVTVSYYQSYTESSSATASIATLSYGTSSANVVKAKKDGTTYDHYDGFSASLKVPNETAFTFTAGKNIAFIHRIEIVPIVNSVVLDESVDNTNTISSYKGKVVDASLKRTLVADKWNTFCVPFDIKEAAEMLKGAEIKEYNEQKGVVDDVMYFKKTNSIVAGFPYLIKPAENIENPTFKNVVVSVDTPKSVGNDDYKFVGVFSPLTFDDTMSGTSLFLSGDKGLVYPIPETTMRGMRAYFSFPGNMPAQSAKIFMGDEETSVADVYGTQKANEEKIFNINGVYVGMSLETLPKGVYVKAGKKFVK